MRILLAAATVALFSSALHAQGLVELGFSGELALSGGGRVECSITFADAKSNGAPRTLELALHVAEHTSAVDLATLVGQRLEQAGAHVLFPGSRAAPLGPANLFVEDVQAVALRLGHGLTCSLTLCEDRPATVRLAPPSDMKQAATLSVAASTIQPHTKEHGRVAIEVGLDEKEGPADLAAKLVRASIDKGWLAELAGHDTWRPNSLTDGSQLQGCSFDLRSKGDWWLEVTLVARGSR